MQRNFQAFKTKVGLVAKAINVRWQEEQDQLTHNEEMPPNGIYFTDFNKPPAPTPNSCNCNGPQAVADNRDSTFL